MHIKTYKVSVSEPNVVCQHALNLYFQFKDSDDDSELPGPSHDSDHSVDLGRSSRDSSPHSESDSQEMTKNFRRVSSIQEDDTSSSDDHDSDKDKTYKEDRYKGDRSSKAGLKGGGTSFTKKNYCYVCGKGYHKIPRHLSRHIDEDPEIAEIFALPKNSAERKSLLAKLRKRGNYKHNQEVLRSNTGPLKVGRRSSRYVMTAENFVHCIYCKVMLQSKDLYRHVAKCAKQTINAATHGETSILGDVTESEFSEKFPSEVWEILSPMKQDEIVFLIQHDYLFMKMAQSLIENSGNDPTNQERVRQKLRKIGRLLIELHDKRIVSFEAALKPRSFYKVVAAVRNLSGFDEKKQKYSKPSLALFFVKSLKKLGEFVVAQSDNSKRAVRDVNTFMMLCAKEWKETGPHKDAPSSSEHKVHSPSTIPFTRDIQTFYTHLEKTSASAIECMKKYETPQMYNALCRVILAQVSVLNKCAPEVSKITLKSFQERDETTQVLSKHFIRINIAGKTGQNVAVLLTSQLVSALTLLMSKRPACGVHEDNPFLFAKPDGSSTSLYHGGHCVRVYTRMCSAKNPEHLTSVHFHKHIARIFQILNLENDELPHLAKLLGHDIRMDRDYYRLPEAAVELAKIAKLLLAMEKGSLERFKGTSLDEIEIEGLCPVLCRHKHTLACQWSLDCLLRSCE